MEIKGVKDLNILFKSTLPESVHLDFHKQSLDMLNFTCYHKLKTIKQSLLALCSPTSPHMDCSWKSEWAFPRAEKRRFVTLSILISGPHSAPTPIGLYETNGTECENNDTDDMKGKIKDIIESNSRCSHLGVASSGIHVTYAQLWMASHWTSLTFLFWFEFYLCF
jgi:hypothetical protein